MGLPFYAETSIFQLYTAVAFACASAFLFSTKRKNWEYSAAALISFYISFDERFMFHECVKVASPGSRHIVGGDLTIFILSSFGITAAMWGIFKLSRSRFEKFLFLFASILCFAEIYLDVYEKTIFYLELDTMIEEVSEMVLAIVLILIAVSAGVRWRVFILVPIFISLLLWVDKPMHKMVWEICPKLRKVI